MHPDRDSIRDAARRIATDVRRTPVLDLPYVEDSKAEVDMNVVMLRPVVGGEARFVEVQGTAEGMAFTRTELDQLLGLAELGLTELADLQAEMVSVPPATR